MTNHEKTLKIRMLGDFSLEWGGTEENNLIREKDGRSYKMWLLLAYMIYCRGRHISQEEMIKLLRNDELETVNPYTALNTTLHRLRTNLSELGVPEDLIISNDGTYAWNTDIPVDYDIELFEQFCTEVRTTSDDEEKLKLCLRALELYKGDFLPRLSMESWVIPISANLHNEYLQIAETALNILEEYDRFEEAHSICQDALILEPCSESLHRHLMLSYAATGNKEAAVSAYNELCHMLLDNFGVTPTEETQEVYREIMYMDDSRTIPADIICSQLQEENPMPGALLCEYNAFRVIYHLMARTISRTEEPVHFAVLNVKGSADKEISDRSRDLAMKNFQAHLLASIRSGDVATRCSSSQFVILLPKADYENSCMVCSRIIGSFFRKHPHSPAEITYTVHPMEASSDSSASR